MHSTSTPSMSSSTPEDTLHNFSMATTSFISYFQEALKSLAPISEQDEDPTPPAKTLSVGAQGLIEEVLQGLCWFRDQNKASALLLGDLDLRLANLQVTTNPIDPSKAWHQRLTLDDIKEKIGGASHVYGQEGLDMLLRLQEKIIKLHRETVQLTEWDINTKLILQDRDEDRQEDKQVLYNSLEASVPEPGGDIVTFCLSICLAVVKPVAKVFCHKKACGHSREIEAMQAAMQAEKERLVALQKQAEGIKKAGPAIRGCEKPLEDIKGLTFPSLAQQAQEVTESGQPIDQISVDLLRSNLRVTLMGQQIFHMQLDEFLNEVECPESGLVRSPTVIRLKEFHNRTKDISKYIGSLLLSAKIIHEKHRDNFVDNIVRIAQEFTEILDKVKNMFTVWGQYVGQGTSEMIFLSLQQEVEEVTRSFIPFDREFGKRIQEITQILEKKMRQKQ